MLLVPELVIWFEGVGAVNFPSKPDFVQNSLLIESHFVIVMNDPLHASPLPKRCIFIVFFGTLQWPFLFCLNSTSCSHCWCQSLSVCFNVWALSSFQAPEFPFNQVQVWCWHDAFAAC
jgi:hypothetical protein